MRIFFSGRTWISASVLCLPCLLSSGCKSTGPGLGWLSWTKPKSLSTSLASNVPTKPSVNSLPPPSSTMGALGTAIGSGTNVAGLPAGQGPGFGAAAGTVPSNAYNTGPYGMAGQTAHPPTAGANSAYAGGTYGGAAPANQNPAAVYNGYQTPYQSSAAPAGGAYRTADSRSSLGNAAVPNANAGSAATGSHNWNNEQWGRNEPRGASQPAGYAEGIPASNASPPAEAWTTPPQATSPAPAGYGERFGGPGTIAPPAAGNSAAPRGPASYRPGSTGRSAGSLPAAVTSGAATPTTTAPGTSSYTPPAGAYPMSNYPTSSYPATDGAPARTANSTGYAGGYSYPSTTPMR